MASELREVWVVRSPDGEILRTSLRGGVILPDNVPGSCTVERLPLLTPDVKKVLDAVRAFAKAKEAWRAAWIEDGVVPPSLTNTLDKATDDLLAAYRATGEVSE